MNKLMILYIICVVLVLSACTPTAREATHNYKLPSELSDCKIFRLMNDSGDVMYVMRCPNSSTTTNYSTGKTSRSITLIEGNDDYEEVSFNNSNCNANDTRFSNDSC